MDFFHKGLFLIFHLFVVDTTSSVTKLSTFTGGLSSKNNSIVQMRRSTNKKGKQAPAPPKRTRYGIFCFRCDETSIIITIIIFLDLVTVISK